MRTKKEEELFRQIHEINKGCMLMLHYWEPFRIDVRMIRDEWNIPASGFLGGEQAVKKQTSAWCKRSGFDDQKFDYLRINKSDGKLPSSLRKPSSDSHRRKIAVKRIYQSPMDLYHVNLDLLTTAVPEPYNYKAWREATNKIRDTYFVPFHFQPYIERYILTGEIDGPDQNHYLHASCSISKNLAVTTKIYIYGIPSQKEMTYIRNNINPLKSFFQAQNLTYRRAHHESPYSRLKADSKDVKEYAKIFELFEQEKGDKPVRTDYQRARILYGETEDSEEQERLAERFRNMKSKGIAKQKLLFTAMQPEN